ncbi:hevamine-A-like [Ziziphus jujuba]|uniref:chitinase n=1 Tax=Ziziphus jujuba TaxID=326968 RepID=A0ABM4AGK1_ZIZJJ|nr:hevamine-A-like [Ziziphus jujuba]
MTVSEYKRRFQELSEFYMHMIPDDHAKKVRFIDGLNENIALTLAGSVHPTYQSARDAALELERQVEMRKPSRRRSFEGSYSGAPSQGVSKKSHSSGSSDAVLDGVDFHIEGGNFYYYDNLARYMKELFDQKQTQAYYLSAVPHCHYPDYYLGNAIDEGLFDFIWVQFYNNPSCKNSFVFGLDKLLFSWNHYWIHSNASQLFLGLPASIYAARMG